MESPAASDLRKRVAAALRFRRGVDTVPTVLGSGRGLMADKILEEAKLHGIPVHEDAQLASTLCHLDAGSAIPPELYEAVAEVIGFVYRLNEIRP